MSEIIEYTHKGTKAFKGTKVCCECGEEYLLDTIDKSLFDKPTKCFMCFMADKNVR